MPWGPSFASLPTTGSPAKSYIDRTAYEQIIDNFRTWKGDVNAAGFKLSNVRIDGGVNLLTGSFTLDFPSIPRGEFSDLSFFALGAPAGAPVVIGAPPTLPSGISLYAWADATNSITVRATNNRPDGAEVDPPAGTYSWSITQKSSGIAGTGVTTSSGTLTFTPSTIHDGDFGVATFASAGSHVGDAIVPGWPDTLEAGLFPAMRVSADGVIEVRVLNKSGEDITPAPAVYSAVTGLGGAPTYASVVFPRPILDGEVYPATFTLTGARTTQKVMPALPATLEAGLLIMMRVSADDTIEMRVLNKSGDAMTPATQLFGATLV